MYQYMEFDGLKYRLSEDKTALFEITAKNNFPDTIVLPGCVRIVKSYALDIPNFNGTIIFNDGLREIEKNSINADNPKKITVVFPDSIEVINDAFIRLRLKDGENVISKFFIGVKHESKSLFIEDDNMLYRRLDDGTTMLLFCRDYKTPLRDDVSIIGDYALNGQETGDINFPLGLKKIGKYALAKNDIKNVILPEGLEEIDDCAFMGNTWIKKVKLPLSLKKMGSGVFCSDYYHYSRVAVNLSLSKKHQYFCEDKKCLYQKNDDGTKDLIFCFKPTLENYTIESDVVNIRSYAFAGVEKIYVTFSEGLKTIGENLFGRGSFDKDISKFQLPSTVEDIGDLAIIEYNQKKGKSSTNQYINFEVDKNNTHIVKEKSILYKVDDNGSTVLKSYAKTSTVKLRSDVKKIGKYAFYKSTNVEKIIVPPCLEEIDIFSFARVPTLKCVTVDNDEYRDKEEGVFLPDCIKAIPYGAFNGAGFVTLTLSDNIEIIDRDAFCNLANLKTVILPKNMTKFGFDEHYYNNWGSPIKYVAEAIGRVFQYCSKSSEIIISEENPYFSTEKGVLFNKDKTEVLACPYVLKGGNFVIPDTVTEISVAFASATLKSLVIPNGVTKIAPFAFGNISEITIPETVTKIGKQSSYNFKKGLTVYGKKGSIAERFVGTMNSQGCKAIFIDSDDTDSSIKKFKDFGIKVEDDGVVILTAPLNKRTVEVPETIEDKPVVKLADRCFEETSFGSSKIKEVILPKTIKSIGKSAFERCRNLEKINLPEGLESIGIKAFQECSKLKELVIPESVKQIGSYFLGDSDYFAPEKIKVVVKKDSYAAKFFKHNYKDGNYNYYSKHIFIMYVSDNDDEKEQDEHTKFLNSIENVSKYEYKANFDGTVSITGIKNCRKTMVCEIPREIRGMPVTKIDIEYGWDSPLKFVLHDLIKEIPHILPYEYIEIDEKNPYLKTDGVSIFSHDIKTLIKANCKRPLDVYEIPEGVVVINKMRICVDKIILPKSLVSIGKEAFGSDVTPNNNDKWEIVFFDGLKTIGDDAFHYSKVKEIHLPNSVLHIGNKAFSSCSMEQFSGAENAVDIGESVFIGSDWYNNTQMAIYQNILYKANGSEEVVVIPEGIEKIAVAAFGSSGWWSKKCTSKKVIIPQTVKIIENYAFKGMECLEEIALPNSIEYIGEEAFCGCSNLKKIVIPDSVKELHNGIFSLCTSLTEVVLPKNIKTLPKDLFRGCTSVKNIELPEGLEVIERLSLPELDKIFIPASVKSIDFKGLYKYYEYKVTPSLSIKKEITVHEDNAFFKSQDGALLSKDGKTLFAYPSKNRKKDSFTIFDGVETIGSFAFANCSSFGEIILKNGIKKIGELAFCGCTAEAIELPETLECVEEAAFANTQNLWRIKFPDSINTMQKEVLVLSGVREVVFPSGMYSIPDGVCFGCRRLEKIGWPEKVKCIGIKSFCESGLQELEIPDSVSHIKKEAFEGTKLKKVVIPKGTKIVEQFAFKSIDYIELYDNLNCNIGQIVFQTAGYAAHGNCAGIMIIRSAKTDEILYKLWLGKGDLPNKYVHSIYASFDQNGGLNIVKVDNSFAEFDSMRNKYKFALYRLEYPYQLSESNAETFRGYLKKLGVKLANALIEDNDLEGLIAIQDYGVITKSNFSKVLEFANSQHKTDIVAFLLNYKATKINKPK